MNARETRQYEMLVRVRNFADTYRDVFSELRSRASCSRPSPQPWRNWREQTS